MRGTLLPILCFGTALFTGAARADETFITRATWYGPGFDGKKMANGDTFDQDDPTHAAAKEETLPLNKRVRITYLKNGRSIEVCIFDRMSEEAHASIDLSKAAARKLGYLDTGIVRVKVVVLDDCAG
jgi:rare lipoprotein A